MKIFPNTSKVTVVSEVNDSIDIPLAYIDANSIEYKIENDISGDFSIKTTEEIFPYKRFKSTNVVLFSKEGKIIDRKEMLKSLVRDGDSYVYIPANSRNFNASTFSYKVVGKKLSKYMSNMPYNINCLCYGCKAYANNLISIFGDAYKKNEAPANIKVNNGDLSLESMLNTSIKNCDVTFVRLRNHNTIIEDDIKTGGVIDKSFSKELFIENYRANIIAIYDSSLSEDADQGLEEDYVKLYHSENKKEYVFPRGIFYNEMTYSTKKFFNIPIAKEGIIYHTPFVNTNTTPILIEEHIDKAFYVYATDEIINNVREFSKIIYETIGYIYFNRYLTSLDYTEWIADKTPDFIVKDMKLSKKIDFFSEHDLFKLFNLPSNEIDVRKVIIDEERYPFVEFTGIKNNFLTFKKKSGSEYKDPISKRDGEISIYSSGKIFFYDEFMYAINDSAEDKIFISKNGQAIEITNDNFRHSSSSIFVKKNTNPLVIHLTRNADTRNGTVEHIKSTEYYIICKPNESSSFLEIIDKDEYLESDGMIISHIKVKQINDRAEIIDMRQRGGGLKNGDADNFNCLDIGHPLGRPYRKGGALIVTLPKQLEPYKERIEDVVKSYCIADDYPIIIFE